MEGREFSFAVPLIQEYVIRSQTHATTGEEKQYLVLRGWASDTSEDLLDGQMTEECVVGMVRICNEKGQNAPVFRNVQSARNARPVVVDIDHSDNVVDQVGFVTSARALYAKDLPADIIARGVKPPVMEVEIWVNLGMSHGRDIKTAIDDGVQLGLSIFGKVKRAFKTRSPASGKVIEQFHDVEISKIALTGAPVNQNTWVSVIRRSMKGIPMPESNETETPVADTAQETPAVAEEAVVEADAPAAPLSEGTTDAAPAKTAAAPTPEASVQALPTSPAPDPAPASLEPEALAELMEAGIIPAPAAPAPAAPEPVVTEVPDPVVSRANPPAEGEWVRRSELESYFTTVREMLTPLPEAVGSHTTALDEVKRSLTAANDLIAKQAATIDALATRLDTLENQSSGARGRMVMRSLLDTGLPAEERADNGLTETERLAAMQALARAGRPEDALALRMGWLKPNQVGVNIPALEEAERRRLAKETSTP